MKKTSTKRALLSAILALVMTVSMLVGTTFAWFTDSVTSAGNKIVAGNLDVELHMYDGSAYVDISNATKPIFGADGLAAAADGSSTLWEPGKTQVVYLAIKNNGSLALKYKVALNVTGIEKDLDKVLTYTITPDAQAPAGMLSGWDATGAKSVKLGSQLVSATSVAMQPGDIHYFALAVHMDELAGNEYMNASISFDLNVLATQLASENDSFGNDYDKIFEVASAEELADAVKENGMIELAGDIELPADFTTLMAGTRSGSSYTGDAFKGTLDGNGFTISGVTDTLFGVIDGATIKNLNLDAAINANGDSVAALAGIMIGGEISNVTVSGSVTGDESVGGLVGRVLADGTITNCTNNAAVTSTGGSDAAGGIVGKAYYTKDGAEINISGCVNNGAIVGTYAAGGIVGFSAANVVDCTNNADVVCNNGTTAGGIVGEQTNYGEVSGNKNLGDIAAGGGNGNAGGIIGWIRYQNNASAYPVNEIILVDGNRNEGNIAGGYCAGGIVGLVYEQGVITNNVSYANTIAAGTGFGGGIAGGLQDMNNGLSLPVAVRFTVTDNTTDAASISGACTDDVAYNNGPHDPTFALIDNNTVMASASSDNEVKNAIDTAASGDTVYISAGTYTLPSSVAGKDIKIVGLGDSKINVSTMGVGSANLTFEDIAVDFGTSGGFKKGIQHSGEVVYNNATIVGSVSLYGTKEVFNNCTFDLTGIADYIWTYGASEVEFNNCTFNTCGKAILIYNEGYVGSSKVTVNGCTFNASASALAGGHTAAAIEIDSSLVNSYELITKGENKVDEDFAGLWRIKNSKVDNVTVNGVVYNKVTIDGVRIAYTTADLTAAINSANSGDTILLDAGDFVMSTSRSNITFKGAGEGVTNIEYTVQHSGLKVGSIWNESHFEDVTFTNTVFTCMEGGGKSTFKNVTFAAGVRRAYGNSVVFDNCTFGSNSEGYALHFESQSSSTGTITINDCEFEGGKIHLGSARNYAFTGCDFKAGTDLQVWGTIVLEGCTVDGVAVTAANVATLFPNLDLAKATVR